MNETRTAAQRMGTLLCERLRAAGVDVDELFVLPHLDGLTISWTRSDGTFQSAGVKAPGWLSQFRSDPDGFTANLAANLPRQLPESYWDEKGRLDLQYLFARVVQDLDRVSRSADDYDNLRAAALLRLLLLDSAPLIHRVNRVHHLPIRFAVGEVLIDSVVDPNTLPPLTGPRLVKTRDGRLFHAVGNGFDPGTSRVPPREMSWDDFLRALVVKVEEHFVPVHEFITHMAYVEGVVHAGEPRRNRPADPALQRWRRMLTFAGRGPLLETVAAIGRVVVASLAELFHACASSLEEGARLFDEETEE